METVTISKALFLDIKDLLLNLSTVESNRYTSQPEGHTVGGTIPFQQAKKIRRTLNDIK